MNGQSSLTGTISLKLDNTLNNRLDRLDGEPTKGGEFRKPKGSVGPLLMVSANTHSERTLRFR